ncbi:MAG: Ig domain-containing protein [Subdoligranulum sp.]
MTVPDSLDVKLNDGNETTVEATVSPADATNVKVSYASTDEAVATVDKDGKVQILQPGECDIVTTLTQEGKKVVEKKTHIKAFYEVEGITLDKTEGILTAGNTVTLNATVLPEEIADETIVTWTSSDEKVATVDENGKVTAIAAGEATITANAGEKSATYKLTVQAKKVAQTTTNKNTNKGNTSSSTGSSAPTSNPAPAQPSAPAEQPSQPTYEEPAQPAPDPQPEQPSGGSTDSNPNDPSGGWEWGGPVLSSPTDNGCTDEERAAALC